MSEYVSEAHIRRTLRNLAKQRVATVLQPGNIWVVENAISHDVKTVAALGTCLMRGWVETLQSAVPVGSLQGQGDSMHLPESFEGVAPIYKLTAAGWDVIHNSHGWVKATFCVALLSLVAAALGASLSWRP